MYVQVRVQVQEQGFFCHLHGGLYRLGHKARGPGEWQHGGTGSASELVWVLW